MKLVVNVTLGLLEDGRVINLVINLLYIAFHQLVHNFLDNQGRYCERLRLIFVDK